MRHQKERKREKEKAVQLTYYLTKGHIYNLTKPTTRASGQLEYLGKIGLQLGFLFKFLKPQKHIYKRT